MMKSIRTLVRQDREKYVIPRRVQDVIPIQKIWEDGIFLTGGRYAKSFRFTDINYQVASEPDKEKMFRGYSAIINSLDCGATTKITIFNHRMSQINFEKSILMPMQWDGLDDYREEYNQMLLDKATNGNGIVQEKFITISVRKKDVDAARSFFARVEADLSAHFSALGSTCGPMNAMERLQILHRFYRKGEENEFRFSLRDSARKGHSFRDYICPDSMERHSDYLQIGKRYARVLYLKDYASYIQDDFVSELTDLNRDMMLSIDMVPIPTDEAVREVENRLLGVETNITNWQRRQNSNNNFSAVVPYDMELQRKESKEFLDDLTTRDQRMIFGILTMVITADTKDQLDMDTDAILSTARKRMCQMAVLKYQQMDGLDTVLPIGTRKLNAFRTLTTESLAVFMPFKVQEIMDKGGIYFGENAISHNLIMCNKENLLNQSAFLLGVPGSGKSFSAKEEIVSIALSTNDDILILDPESEFGFLVEALGGEVIRVSASSDTHLNAMDMDKAYGDERNPLIEKSEFILSLFEQLVGAGNVSAKEKSILDRCTYDVYREYVANNYEGEPPTLKDLYHSLLKQPEPEARGLALSSELFITGSLNTFAQRTNVDTKARIIAYDIRELGEQLMPIGMLVTLDAIFNRVIQNWKKGKTTWVFADEFYLLFRYEYSADFFYKLWKRIRKYNGLVTGLTQNVEELLRSDTARLMLANSEFLILLNQSATDRDELAGLLHISENQLSYITNVAAGCGLIRCAGNIVPFENSFPRSTRLYQLMTTKPDEALRGV